MLLRSASNLHREDTLRTMVPLDTPLSVQIDTTNICNFKCVFCPTGNEDMLEEAGRPKGSMDPALFAKVVEDLKAFPRKVRDIYMYKDGEPLVNRQLPEMIAADKAADIAEVVHITSNGSLLKPELASRLIDAGLDAVRFSIYGANEETYAAITRRPGMHGKVLENVRQLFALKEERGSSMHIHCKIVDTNLTPELQEEFVRTFGAICDSYSVNSIMGWSNTGKKDLTLGLAPILGISGESPLKPERKVCPEPFRRMAVNFNGTVSACCVDWSLAATVGNVAEESLVDIWNGEALREFRLTHLRGLKDTLKACDGCQFIMGFAQNWDLDDVAAELIPAFSA